MIKPDNIRCKVTYLLFILFFCGISCNVLAQGFLPADSVEFPSRDTVGVEYRIAKLSESVEALNSTIDISVTNVSIKEFIRAVANLSGLNINVAPELDFVVVNNFTKVRVADLLVFICKLYNLSISSVGNIIDLYRPLRQPRLLKGIVEYNKEQDILSVDFQNIPLSIVTRQLTMESGINIFAEPDIHGRFINIYAQGLPFKSAMQNLARANNLDVSLNDDGSYFIRDVMPKQPVDQNQPQQQYNTYQSNQVQSYQPRRSQRNKPGANEEFELSVTKAGLNRVTVNAVDAPIAEVIKDISKHCGANYFIGTELKDVVTLSLTNVEYEDILKGMFIGKDITYVRDGNTYIVGDRKLDAFKVNRIIKFSYRPVDSLLVRIPKEFTQGLTLKEFPELNCILASGSHESIVTFEEFCRQIDKLVPVIMIEVMIVDMKTTITTDTGIEAGLGEVPNKSTGKIFPAVDIKLSTKGINSIINKINGTGLANLGNVSKDFYLNIKALESEGFLKIRSTPILSTLNGNEAKINIGNTEYYLIEESNITAGQSPIVSTTRSYPSVEAKLEIVIKPYVSGDEQITLNVKVSQSDFTERIDKFAPPGKVTRDFESKIRVKNQDMVLLGGLEEKSNRESASGVPLLQRIPVLKWFFSSRSKEKSDSKLNIFIRPTIIG